MVETITHESQFEVWQLMLPGAYAIRVCVIQLNPGELIRRKSLGTEDQYRHGNYPISRKDRLIWRRWDIGTAPLKSFKVAEYFRVAEGIRSALHNGKQIPPSYERKFKDHETRTKRTEKTNLG